MKPLRCIWCCKDTKTDPCENCGSDQVCDPNKPHVHHWSRRTIITMECKVCDKVISNKDYFSTSGEYEYDNYPPGENK